MRVRKKKTSEREEKDSPVEVVPDDLDLLSDVGGELSVGRKVILIEGVWKEREERSVSKEGEERGS